MDLVYGALILVSMIVMAGVVITYTRIENEMLKAKRERMNSQWDWN